MEASLANRSLVVIATVAVASTMGLTSVISLLKPGNNSISEVSISESFVLPEKKHWTKIPAKGWNEVLKEDREFREKLRKDNTEWKKMKSDFLKLKNFFSWK